MIRSGYLALQLLPENSSAGKCLCPHPTSIEDCGHIVFGLCEYERVHVCLCVCVCVGGGGGTWVHVQQTFNLLYLELLYLCVNTLVEGLLY